MEDAAVIKYQISNIKYQIYKPKIKNFWSFICIFYFLFFIFGLDAFITSDCFGGEDKSVVKEDTDQEIKDFSLVQYTSGGKKKWELNGDTAKVSGALIEIGRPYATFYGENSKINLSAEKGFYNKPQNDVQLKQNVVVTSSDGIKMTTDYLNWEANSQNITTSAPVLVTKDNLKTTGIGASCYLEENRLKFNENVRADMEPEPTTITCDGPLELNYGKFRATFHKNVEVRDVQAHMFSDRMDVFFDPGSKKVKRVIASGNVRIFHGENVTYSRVAIYLVDEKRVILPKRPKLVIVPDKKEEK